MAQQSIETYQDFYLYYLTQHMERRCRNLHLVGTTGVFIVFFTMLATQNWWLFFAMPLLGYGFAWLGHFGFEKNKPAAFSKPWWSLISDFVMYFDFLSGRLPAKLAEARTAYPTS